MSLVAYSPFWEKTCHTMSEVSCTVNDLPGGVVLCCSCYANTLHPQWLCSVGGTGAVMN